MKKNRSVLKFFISFLLMFSVIIMQISFFINTRLLNGSFYKNLLNKSQYFSLMRKDINFGFRNLSLITSIPDESFTSAVSDEDIKQLSDKNINSTEAYMKYNNKYVDNKIDTNTIYKSLVNYSQKSNLNLDANLKNQLLSVSNDAGKIVDNYAVLFNISAVSKYSQFQSFRKAVYAIYSIKVLSITAIIAISALLLLLNKREKWKVFLWIGSSLIPAAIITLVPSMLALYYRIPYRFSIDSDYIKLALRDITIGYINYFAVSGAVILLAGLCCMFVYNHYNNKAYRNE